MELVLASNNMNKLRELGALLVPMGMRLIPQGQLNIPEAEEPFLTFVENALTKARHASKLSNKPAIADDSGVSVQVLDGEPGIYSARYAHHKGELSALDGKSDAANNALLLKQLQGVTNRNARFICVLAALRHAEDPEPLIAIGRWDGIITDALKGDGGFGYDPLMMIPDLGKTVAELSIGEKNRLSHRAQAMQQMQQLMRTYWSDLLLNV
ncbi:MAG: RdgB/HAM1 family non-canonical purine NTP pyrophosphatase [Saezia sp.]